MQLRSARSNLRMLALAGATCLSAGPEPDLVDVATVNPHIVIELRYATANNFTRKKLYDVERCFLRRDVAARLSAVQQDLMQVGLGLKVWDGYRPRSVQRALWAASPSPGFVSIPSRGSRHNRGAAVDVTLVDFPSKQELAMPTPYDEFSVRANAHYSGLPENVMRNRTLLQRAMTKRGFQILRTEWWHFDAVDWRDYPLADIPLSELARTSGKLPGEAKIPVAMEEETARTVQARQGP